MLPGWVLRLEDYAHWLQECLEGFAGEMVNPPYLDIQDLPTNELIGLGMEASFRLRQQDISVYSTQKTNLSLKFSLIVLEFIPFDARPAQIAHETYSFHLSARNHPLIWRYDLHAEGHHGLGTPFHKHYMKHGREEVVRSDEVDIGEILRFINVEFQT